MKNTLPANRSPLAPRPVIAFCLLSCILPSIVLAGSIAAWGNNDFGQCNVPFPNTGFVDISNTAQVLGLKYNGSITAWGYNKYGECNIPSPNSDFISISAGWYHSLGLKSNGSIIVWGDNYDGQCNVPSPNTDFVAVAAGAYHSLGLKSDSSIVAWGYNGYSQCNVPSPNTGFIAIAAGYTYSLGLKSDGSIKAWGWNTYGQCNVPSPNTGFIAIAAGYYHSLGLKSDGSIITWGRNNYGQCDVPIPNTGFVAIAAGYYHSLGLKSDGSIVAWGRNTYGECNIPSPNTNFMAISAGWCQSLGLRSSPFSDLSGDAFVDFLDYSIFAKDWQQILDPCDPNNGDITKDNMVDIFDLFELGESWLACFVEQAANPNPSDKSNDSSRHLVLQWSPGEKSISHDIYFGTDFNDVNNADVTNLAAYMGNQDTNFWDTNNFDSNGFDFNSTYYWRIDEVTPACQTKGNVWTFTVDSGIAKNPQPGNVQNNTSPYALLNWTPATDAVSHNVYFGTDFNEVNIAEITSSGVYMGNQISASWDTSNYSTIGLNFNMTYYWRIDEIHEDCVIRGYVWSFTVAPLGKATSPQPTDGQTNITIYPILSWSSATYASSHDIYFGTSYNNVNMATHGSSEYMGNQTSTIWDINNFAPAGLNIETIYFWRVDEINRDWITKGDVWNFTTWPEPNIDNGLTTWWKFDEGTETTAYDSAGSNNGTIYGGATWTTGKIAGALSFNGSSNYIDCGSGPSNYDNITVMAWMKTSTNGVLVSNRYNNGSYGTWYTLSSTCIELGGNNNGVGYAYFTFNTSTLDGLWHHVVYTKDGTNNAIYVDGSPDQQFTSNADISWSVPLYIGKKWNKIYDISWFNGVIDDVRIYNRALSAAEVALLYAQQ
jgi:hypothetical protein